VSIRRILLAVALVLPVGLFIRQQWVESQVCAREFGSEAETSDYEICIEYGSSPEGFCSQLDRNPFSCSTGFIAGHRKLEAARRTGLFQARLERRRTDLQRKPLLARAVGYLLREAPRRAAVAAPLPLGRAGRAGGCVPQGAAGEGVGSRGASVGPPH
jgi:hypothetical protein